VISLSSRLVAVRLVGRRASQSIQPADPSLTLAGPATAVDPTLNARARRWDQTGPSASSNGIPLSAGSWTQLENGIQVCFAPGTYNPGDYWTIAARTATGTIEWPPCGSDGDAYQSPHSMLVAQAPLGCIPGWRVLRYSTTTFTVTGAPPPLLSFHGGNLPDLG
jgi:hypothetical protein